MTDKINYNYFRLLTLTIILSFVYLLYTQISDLSDEISDVNSQLLTVQQLREKTELVPLLRQQIKSGGGISFEKKYAISHPSGFLPVVNSILQKNNCRIIATETRDVSNSKETISITLNLTFEAGYSDWVKFRKNMAVLDSRIEFLNLEMTSGSGGKVTVKELIKFTRFVE